MIPYNSSYIKYALIALLVGIGLGSLWYTRYLGQELLDMEKSSLELWAKTIEYSSSDPYATTRYDLRSVSKFVDGQSTDVKLKNRLTAIIQSADDELGSAPLNFITSEILLKQRFDIPAIITDARGKPLMARNFSITDTSASWKDNFQSDYPPIRIALPGTDTTLYQYLYYGESSLIRMLKYFPFIQLGLVGLVFSLAYISWSSIRRTEQSNVWVGMAREAAHQLGTPISGLMGWVELLKLHGESDKSLKMLAESLDQDVHRLHSVADRFEKIGSKPEVHLQNLFEPLNSCIEYLKSRSPIAAGNFELSLKCDPSIKIPLNTELLTWGIENILKNALDARLVDQKAFKIVLEVQDSLDSIRILITDNGRGMEKNVQKQIFNPGFSTKKRGWGLGLSLTKRIVEEYHRGTIIVSYSEIGKGTTFQIDLPRA